MINNPVQGNKVNKVAVVLEDNHDGVISLDVLINDKSVGDGEIDYEATFKEGITPSLSLLSIIMNTISESTNYGV